MQTQASAEDRPVACPFCGNDDKKMIEELFIWFLCHVCARKWRIE